MKGTFLLYVALVLASCAPGGMGMAVSGTGTTADVALVAIKDDLPDGVAKGYVGFYYLKSEGNPPAPTYIYRIECNEELLEEEVTHIWPSRDKVELWLAKLPGVYHFVIHKAGAEKKVRVRAEKGMVTPVRIYFADTQSQKTRRRIATPSVSASIDTGPEAQDHQEYVTTSFTMVVTVETPAPSRLDASLPGGVKTNLPAGGRTGIPLTPAQEVAEAVADLHTAMRIQDIDTIVATHSAGYGRPTGADRLGLRGCYERIAAQDLLQKTIIDQGVCEITVEGESAMAGPVTYVTPHMGEVRHDLKMKREADGKWRLVDDGDPNTLDPGFEVEGPLCIPMQLYTTPQRPRERIFSSIGMEFVYVRRAGSRWGVRQVKGALTGMRDCTGLS